MDPQVTRALDVVARAPRLLVATDFDGVLAPFVLDPMDARPQAGTVESLGRLKLIHNMMIESGEGSFQVQNVALVE